MVPPSATGTHDSLIIPDAGRQTSSAGPSRGNRPVPGQLGGELVDFLHRQIRQSRAHKVSDIEIRDPCIVFPLRRESRAFRWEFRPHQRFGGAPCWARFGGPEWLTVLMLETGVGAERVEEAVAWVLERPQLEGVPYRPKVVLVAGFAGALDASLRVGDVVLATEVADGQGECWPAPWPGELPAGRWQPPLRRGRVLTLPQLAASPEEKRRLGQEHAAVAVDMESSAAARLCARHGVPFGCVRAISDSSDEPLAAELAAVLSRGRVSPLRLLLALARSPGLGRDLWRLARHSRLAAEQLAKALGELLTLTLPWGNEL
jgi:adenosylhomocysteine nucleosidase